MQKNPGPEFQLRLKIATDVAELQHMVAQKIGATVDSPKQDLKGAKTE